MPRSSEYIEVRKGVRIHVRSSWPEPDVPLRGTIFYCHGLGAHANRPQYRYMIDLYTGAGYALGKPEITESSHAV